MIDPTAQLIAHQADVKACRLCPKMVPPPVNGQPVRSRVLLVGQAPGAKEPVMGRPFAWTAGKTLFRWFRESCGTDETEFRASVYMAAVCRCFPGKASTGGDRVPNPQEVLNCSRWLKRELELLQPELVVPVGKLAIAQFIPITGKLDTLIGGSHRLTKDGVTFDLVPLPHPSGASPWHRMEPGKTLLEKALRIVAEHPAWLGRIQGR